jgi:hypothetical protein
MVKSSDYRLPLDRAERYRMSIDVAGKLRSRGSLVGGKSAASAKAVNAAIALRILGLSSLLAWAIVIGSIVAAVKLIRF